MNSKTLSVKKYDSTPSFCQKIPKIKKILEFFMGKNTPKRQEFIIENLRIEKDLVEEEAA